MLAKPACLNRETLAILGRYGHGDAHPIPPRPNRRRDPHLWPNEVGASAEALAENAKLKQEIRVGVQTD
jgi:hypothetical protein